MNPRDGIRVQIELLKNVKAFERIMSETKKSVIGDEQRCDHWRNIARDRRESGRSANIEINTSIADKGCLQQTCCAVWRKSPKRTNASEVRHGFESTWHRATH